MDTLAQYQSMVGLCREIYHKKIVDYGTSWRILRPISIVDQLYIKAWRIRKIQENGHQKVEDSIENEFMGIVNYGIIALIQSALPEDSPWELSEEKALELYDQQVRVTQALMLEKNHDYGEAWRSLSQASFADLILTKLLRVKQILANDHQTLISEGTDANFKDIVNYAIFALIQQSEQQ